jgi:hypothetical protein
MQTIKYCLSALFLLLALVRVNSSETSKELPTVSSFDIFDTLVGRLHPDPRFVFQLVEENYPYPDFVFLRRLAELQSNGTLEQIYQRFRAMTGISEEEAKRLMDFELTTELSHVFPIMENVQKVKNGDFLVSDTYYNFDQLKRILEKIGLEKNIQVFFSPNGKSSGMIWKALKEIAHIQEHLGDNYKSDVVMAREYNIPASHYQNCQFSSSEQTVWNAGQKELASLMRALRLQNPYPKDSAKYVLWNEQAEWNIPLLIQASIHLDQFCKTHRKTRILFTSRDCCLWIKIFQKMFPEYESIYFHSSRNAYRHPTDSYIEYVKSLYTQNTVIADGPASGSSCSTFFKNYLQLHPTYFAIMHHKGTTECPFYGVQVCSEGFCNAIECLNVDYVGCLESFQDGKPIRAPCEYSKEYVDAIHACTETFLKIYPAYTINLFDKNLFSLMMRSLQQGIRSHHYLPHFGEHFVEKPAKPSLRAVDMVVNFNMRDFFLFPEEWKSKNIDLRENTDIASIKRVFLEPSTSEKIVLFNLILEKEVLEKIPKKKLVYFLWEPWEVSPSYYESFGKVYTWNDDLVDNQKFFKIYYPSLMPMITDVPAFEQKKLCVMVAGTDLDPQGRNNDLYSQRIRMVEFFETKPPGELDIYGKNWSRRFYRDYKGPIPGFHSGPEKINTLKNYRFSVCFENTQNVNGYITEKIFCCFAAGCVPIYWGAKNVESYIPKNCFIDYRDFKSKEELYSFLTSMSKKTYESYLENIRLFLQSDAAKVFSPNYFQDLFHRAIKE